ncbi:MAG: transcriptional repressor [Bacteroidales bacterium]|nr:transcriptional repressor [Bacteroidales bacterium]
MSKIEIEKLLKEHGIKATANRLLVAEALDEARRPLSMMELEYSIGSIDKSGIFRSLATFKEHHLVHSIEDVEGTRYELCLSHDIDHDEDTHVHFYCEKCHRTFCLDDIHIPPVSLPEGYDARTANYLLKGICPECSGHHFV